MSFSELPHEKRFAILQDLWALGAETSGYYNGGVQVCVPRGKFSEITGWAQRNGLKNSGLFYFPLGTDTPNESLRHDGPHGKYPEGNRGFWLYGDYKLKELENRNENN